MGRYFLVADSHGWHHPVNRTDMKFDCERAAADGRIMRWTSSMRTDQHAVLVRQWMLPGDDRPRSDEWVPAEWLLRVWESPAMAAAEANCVRSDVRLFELDAQPVLLARSIPVVIPELGLAGVDEFRVAREAPRWWLLGPCGREVLALLKQFQALAAEYGQEPVVVDDEIAVLGKVVLDVVDATARVGAYNIVRAVIGEIDGPDESCRQLAFGAALGLVVKDVWPEAPRLYRSWAEHFGLPDIAAVIDEGDFPYPSGL